MVVRVWTNLGGGGGGGGGGGNWEALGCEGTKGTKGVCIAHAGTCSYLLHGLGTRLVEME